ncbi:hypothetical protein PR048_009452 [Dryococelus australis]|uniref:Uncharacterized protein n=1 Tax=Dryococelus australis TaxID=614101 RepID=A0ABQ9HZX8_9NEOP|nr:hypothetical protein PR048_009452 [Dryococelus australis]
MRSEILLGLRPAALPQRPPLVRITTHTVPHSSEDWRYVPLETHTQERRFMQSVPVREHKWCYTLILQQCMFGTPARRITFLTGAVSFRLDKEHSNLRGAAVAERLACSPHTKVNRV